MRVLHTSDWHIGKRLMGRERLDEQAEVLDEIVSLCEKENVELVVVAGDIFDTFVPSAGAEELFFQKIKAVAGENRAVVIISGNHDDGVRLSASAPLAESHGVYIVGNDRRPFSLSSVRPVRPIESGKGYATFENGKGEKVYLSLLPYPSEARFREEKSDLPYVDRMKGWLEEGVAANVEKLPSVLIAHIFVAGGCVSDSERNIDVGGAKAVPLEYLPSCDYIALGHLHKKQHMGKGHCYYSGSPLQYSFDESTEKSVRVFDLTVNGVENLRECPLTKGRRLIRLQTASVEDAEKLLESYPEKLVELTLLLSSPLTSSETAALAAHENLVELKTEIRASGELPALKRKAFTDEKMFDEYYRASFGADVEVDARLKALFLECLAEVDERK